MMAIEAVRLGFKFSLHEIKIRIVDNFIFVEAVREEGEKGVNFSRIMFKKCIKTDNNTILKDLMAVYKNGVVIFGYEMSGKKISIDKKMMKVPRKIKKSFWIDKNDTGAILLSSLKYM